MTTILDRIKKSETDIVLPLAQITLGLVAGAFPYFEARETDATVYDYVKAVDTFMQAIGMGSPDGDPLADVERPQTDDERPLYQRLADYPHAEKAAQKSQIKLDLITLLFALGPDEDLAGEFAGATEAFWDALGIPEGDTDPNMNPNAVDGLVESYLAAQSADTSKAEEGVVA